MYIVEPFLDKVWRGDPEIRQVMSVEQYQAIQNHNFKARDVCTALRMPIEEFNGLWDHERERIYGELADILEENPRLALYLPFYVLRTPTENFKKHYHKAWLECTLYTDVREAFHLGDIYEPSARQGDPERVIKSMHLIPWLVRYGYITTNDIVQYARAFQNVDNITIWGIYDGVYAAHALGWIDIVTFKTVQNIVREAKCPRPSLPILTRVTPERAKWLEDREQNYRISPGEFKFRNVTGPFYDNIDIDALKGITFNAENEIVILHGSRLNGYGRKDSDYDYKHYDVMSGVIAERPELSEQPELIAHLILSGAWIGQHGEEVRKAQFEAASRYYKASEKTRINSMLYLEKALLHYRLMHKGMFCAYPDISADTKHLNSIDGDSAFYDDRYRTIASQLFLKYIYIPPKG